MAWDGKVYPNAREGSHVDQAQVVAIADVDPLTDVAILDVDELMDSNAKQA